MGTESWSPPGVDVEALRAEESELVRRLGIVRSILRALSAGIILRPEGTPSERPAGTSPSNALASLARTGGKKQRALLEILEAAGGPVHHSVIYPQMQERFPGLTWKSASEVIRAYTREMNGLVISLGNGTFGLSARDKKGGAAITPRP